MAAPDHARTLRSARRASVSNALSTRGTSDVFHTPTPRRRSVLDETVRTVAEFTAPRQTVVEQARNLAQVRRFSILGTAISDPAPDSQDLHQHATSTQQSQCVADRRARRGSLPGAQILAERATPSTRRKSVVEGTQNLAHPSLTRRKSVEEARDLALIQGLSSRGSETCDSGTHGQQDILGQAQRTSLRARRSSLSGAQSSDPMISSSPQQSAIQEARNRTQMPRFSIAGMDTRDSSTPIAEQTTKDPQMRRQRRNSLFTESPLMRRTQTISDPSHWTRTAIGRRHSIVGVDSGGTDALIGLQCESVGAMARRQSNVQMSKDGEDDRAASKNSIGEKFLRRKLGTDRFAAYCVGTGSGNAWGQHDKAEKNLTKSRRQGLVESLGLMRFSLMKEYFDKGGQTASSRTRTSTRLTQNDGIFKDHSAERLKGRRCTTDTSGAPESGTLHRGSVIVRRRVMSMVNATKASTIERSWRSRRESGRNDAIVPRRVSTHARTTLAESTSTETVNSTFRRRSTGKRTISEADTCIDTSSLTFRRRSTGKRAISEEDTSIDTNSSTFRRRSTRKRTISDGEPLSDAHDSAARRRSTRKRTISDEDTSTDTGGSAVTHRLNTRKRTISDEDTSSDMGGSAVTHRRNTRKRTISDEDTSTDMGGSAVAHRRNTRKRTISDENSSSDMGSSAVTHRRNTRKRTISDENSSTDTRGSIIHRGDTRKRAFSQNDPFIGARASEIVHRRTTHKGTISDDNAPPNAPRANAVHRLSTRRQTHDTSHTRPRESVSRHPRSPPRTHGPPPIQRRGSLIVQRSIALLEERRALNRAETLPLGHDSKDRAHQKEVLDVVRTGTQQTIEKMKRTKKTDVMDVAGIGQFIERELMGAHWLPDAAERLAHWRQEAEMQVEANVARQSMSIGMPSSMDPSSSSSSSSSGTPSDKSCDEQSTNTFFTDRILSPSIHATPTSRNFPSPLPRNNTGATADIEDDACDADAFNSEVAAVNSVTEAAEKYRRRHSVHVASSIAAAAAAAAAASAAAAGAGLRNSALGITRRGSVRTGDRRNSLTRLIALCGGNVDLAGTKNEAEEDEFIDPPMKATWPTTSRSLEHLDRDSNCNASVIVTQPRDSGPKNSGERTCSPSHLGAASQRYSPSPCVAEGLSSLNAREGASASTPSPLPDARLSALRGRSHFRSSVGRAPSPVREHMLSVLSVHRASLRDGSLDEKRHSVLYEDAPVDECEDELKECEDKLKESEDSDVVSSGTKEEEILERPRSSLDSHPTGAPRSVAVPECSVCPGLDQAFRRKFLCRIPRSMKIRLFCDSQANKVCEKMAGQPMFFSVRPPDGGVVFPTDPPGAERLVLPHPSPRKAAIHTWLSNRQGSTAGEMTRVAPHHVLMRRLRTRVARFPEVAPVPALV